MTKKKKLSIIIPALSAVVCVVMCVLLWWEMNRPQQIEFPIEQLTWGMTDREAERALQQAGLDVNIAAGDGMYQTKSYGLRTEDLAKLGFDGIGTLSLSTKEFKPVLLEFTSFADGQFRLTGVEIVAEVPVGKGATSMATEKEVTKVLNSLYGSPNERGAWSITPGLLGGGGAADHLPPEVHAEYHDVRVGEVKLVYMAQGYVYSLHGSN